MNEKNQKLGLTIKRVDIFGDEIVAAKDKNGNIWAGVSYFCKALGMNKGEKDRQTANVQSDDVLNRGATKFAAGVFDDNNETIALRIDFVPIWLTKISITPKMKKEKPEMAEKLLNYQLKAKDILAAAFLPAKETTKEPVHNHASGDIPVGEISRLSAVMERIMVRQKSKPHEIARAFECICGQFGISLPERFVNEPEYQQLTISDFCKEVQP